MLMKVGLGILCFVGLILVFTILIYSIIPTLVYKVRHKKNRLFGRDRIYLTFDDGPHPIYTNMLLDVLDRYNVKASFFVVGDFAKENPDVIARMKREGHLICMHSLKHKNGLFQPPFEMRKDFENSIKIINDMGICTDYYRPPWGHFNLATHVELKNNNLSPVLWDVMAEDWRGNTTSTEIIRKLSKRVIPGDIICLHDGRGKNEAPKKMIEALDIIIPIWLSEGYKFDTVNNYEIK